MPFPIIDPVDGPETDRFVTVLLNLGGVMHQIVASTPSFEADEHEADGLAVIAEAAQETRRLLAQVAEHNEDEDLEFVTQFLALTTLVLADGIGHSHVFRDRPE
jgi:hypothetical protein